jgi:thiol-disulfide isomerase/thioredoxin
MKYLFLFMALFAGVIFWVLNDAENMGAVEGMPAFESSYESAMASAKATGKPAIIVFSAPWCPPCQMMKKEVYPSAEVAAVKDQFVWAYLDVDLPQTQASAAKYGVKGIPAIYIVNSSEKTISQRVGGVSAQEFAAWLSAYSGG